MPKIKFTAKKIQKMDIEPKDLALAIVESWDAVAIADLLTEIMEQVGYEGKEGGVVEQMGRFGYKDHLLAWAEGRVH